MATLETQKLDSIIASRRALLKGVGALAAVATAGEKVASAAVPATPTDAQVLNFALNLEYLEAQFYTLATEGVTADKSTYGSAIGTGAGTSATGGGAVTVKTTGTTKVPFASKTIQAYANETALEERKHVNFLRGALGSGAVAQPAINLVDSFRTLGNALTPAVANFDPFLNDLFFLYGAYIFEDVGVTAYHGGAAYLSKQYLTPAVGIHAVEAYHAGLIRSTLYALDQGASTIPGLTIAVGSVAPTATSISNLRATLDGTIGKVPTDAFGLTGQDDFGLTAITVPLNGTNASASTILDTGKVTAANSSTFTYNFYIGFARTIVQVLNIVYGSAGATPTKGLFFPNGLNGDVN